MTDDGWEYDGSASSTIEYAFEVAIEDSPPGQARLLMTVTGDAGVNLVGATPGRNTPPLEEAPLGAHHAVFGSGTSGVPTSTLPCEFSVAGGDAVSDYGVLCSVRDTGTFESGDTDEAALRAALPVLNSGPIFLAFDIGTGGGGCRVLLFPDGSVKLAFEQSQCTLT